ncbi:MAG TPA: BON domain-containing protein [Terriglobales bacterium]|nr:BON domain-containing protein [Terriglobales bacterium]
MKDKWKNMAPVVALAALMTLGPVAQASTTAAGRYDSEIQASVVQKLEKDSDFQNVRSTVEDGIVTLTGKVQTLKDKLDAAKQVRKSSKQVNGVRNLIEVTSTVPDSELFNQLSKRLAHDRVGWADNAFNAIHLAVKDGVVTLSGQVMDYPAYNSALAEAQSMKGVKEVVNNLNVLPASPYDDQLRARLYRAIYGDNSLSKYALDPVRPIKIIVDRGKIGLYGKVDSEFDKTIAGMRAGQVFGGFSVENHLTTPNQVAVR